AANGFKLAGVGLDAKIASTQGSIFAGDVTVNRSPEKPRRAINPPVKSPTQTIHTGLVIMGGKSGVKDLAHVPFAIAVGVFQVKNVGSSANERAFFPCHDASWKGHVVGKRVRVIEVSIIPGAGKNFDSSAGFELPVHAHWIIMHFSNPKPAIWRKI